MAYIYCICHDGVGYIGKDKREVSQYTRLIDHLNNSFIPSSKDNSVITIHRWGLAGNEWLINDDAGSCFGVSEEAYKGFKEMGWQTETKNNEIVDKLNFAEMIYTILYPHSYASLNYIIGGTPSYREKPWTYNLKKDQVFKDFVRELRECKVSLPSVKVRKGKNEFVWTGRTFAWGRFVRTPEEAYQLVVHWQMKEDAMAKILHPHQYGALRIILDSISRFLSTDKTILRYLIVLGVGEALVENPLNPQLDTRSLFNTLSTIVRAIFNQLWPLVEKHLAMKNAFKLDDIFLMTLLDNIKPVIKAVCEQITRILNKGVNDINLMVNKYQQGINRVNFTKDGKITEIARKSFLIKPSYGLFRWAEQQTKLVDPPEWYKKAISAASTNGWIKQKTSDEVKKILLATFYKNAEQVVELTAEPQFATATVNIDGYPNKIMNMTAFKGPTLSEKVRASFADLTGWNTRLPADSTGIRILISAFMTEQGMQLTGVEKDDKIVAISKDQTRAYFLQPAIWQEILGYYGKGVKLFADPANWKWF